MFQTNLRRHTKICNLDKREDDRIVIRIKLFCVYEFTSATYKNESCTDIFIFNKVYYKR